MIRRLPLTILVLAVLWQMIPLWAQWISAARAQQSESTDPVFWCDISRSQVSHERDAALAQIERLKNLNLMLEARIRALEAKAKESSEVKPNE